MAPYVAPSVIASYDLAELLNAAEGFMSCFLGNEGNDKDVGQGECHSAH
ncbi:MAG: hypothetical protein ACXWNK_05455 [Vulcanimicrobiaceae bacterium]